ncbi:hypothetical protein HNE_3137 [Hyphomonas neptunium ATCC 15444]|uniref:Uncharacterized protein n=2 Tax=Hyphomonas TaxID=85 RepID=Q0BXI0_HYPNA|nr:MULTISPECIES: hypothetical protein [Hyphomonas]ABI75962.1 hypothetical protein HNE_3137 [Hyphomonas neptunium ATCC 15444]KCZ89922.1 hypothetical protein HHI_13960 [Hyphomonas hirschiana VP5]
MTDERHLKEAQRAVALLGLEDEVSQDTSEARLPCPLHEDCIASGDNNLVLNWQRNSYACANTGESGPLRDLVRQLENLRSQVLAPAGRSAQPPETQDANSPPSGPIDAEFTEVTRASNAVLKTEPKVLQLRPEQKLPTPQEIQAEREDRLAALKAQQAEKRRGQSERMIIGALSLVFLLAGLGAAGLSGFANYQAFSSTVSDPMQGRIWGWAGVIAAIISFGGFTFVYWHGANRRFKEAARALIFAGVGAGASILGTEIYIRGNAEAAAAAVETASSNRDVLASQIADWRRQLEGIPPETRSVEGLEAYILEVERVGRTEQKPYRDAQNELGLARRRDELITQINAANAELLGQGSGNILLQAEQRASLPSWLFAALLELFSSQATSIGFVALLLLASGKRGAEE